MNDQFGIRSILANNPIVPVVNIERLAEVSIVMDKLHSQGINCIEITLRSDVAFDAIAQALQIKPEGFSVGVGTVINEEQINRCKALGVDFMVSPGLTPHLADAFSQAEIAYLPGVMTPSEIIDGMEMGVRTFKLFPFNLAGGIKALKTYGAVFPEARFCPTGGISASTYKECLDLDNVISVGGSWVAK